MKRLAAILFSLSLFIFPSAVFAGGGLVSFTTAPDGTLNPGQEFVVRPLVYSGNYGGVFCKHCQIKVKLENPQSNDYIAASSDTTDDNGTMYAKIISYIPGNRLAYVQVLLPNGAWYNSSDVVLNYTGANVSAPTAAPAPTPHFYIKLDGQKYADQPKRYVYLSWDNVPGAQKYDVYVRVQGDKDWGAAVLGTGLINGVVDLNQSLNYEIKVAACQSADNCTDSANTLSLAAVDINNSTSAIQVSPTLKTKDTHVSETRQGQPISATASGANSAEKIASLQAQLNASLHRESALQREINSLMNFVKSIFPFWK